MRKDPCQTGLQINAEQLTSIRVIHIIQADKPLWHVNVVCLRLQSYGICQNPDFKSKLLKYLLFMFLFLLFFQAVHTVFLFNTGDASGQNMATVSAWHILEWIMKNTSKVVDIRRAWVEANATSDKKSGNFNILHGRCMSTEAKVVFPETVLNKYLNVDTDSLMDLYKYSLRMKHKNTPGGGLNLNPANTLTALFIATGQDPASIPDCIAGSDFNVERNGGQDGGVTATLTLQNLLVGTVGGGTVLPSQTECLEMLHCKGAGKVRKFAEIATAFAMALDISSLTHRRL